MKEDNDSLPVGRIEFSTSEYVRGLNFIRDNQRVFMPETTEIVLRADQKPRDDDWEFWLLLQDRDWGKTTALAAWTLSQALTKPKSHGGVVLKSSEYAMRDFTEIVLKCCPKSMHPEVVPTRRSITFRNGSKILFFDADNPDELRGTEFHWAAGDNMEAWGENYGANNHHLKIATRLGDRPQIALATRQIHQDHLHGLLNTRTMITSSWIVE